MERAFQSERQSGTVWHQSGQSGTSPEKKKKQFFSRLIFAKLVFALHQSGQSGTSPEPVRKLIGSRQFLSRGTTKKVACFRYMMINPLESNDIHGIHGISDVPEARCQGRKQAQRWHTKIVFWLRGVQLLTLPRPGVWAKNMSCDNMKIWVLIERGAIFDAPETRLRIGKRNWKASECAHQPRQSGISPEPVRK